jgi:SPP1 gp7 family putative phage head morphogenesis protein
MMNNYKRINEVFEKAFKIDITKSLNPLDPDDFLIISARLSRALGKISRPHHREAARQALTALDVDWKTLSPKARNKVIREASRYIAGTPINFIEPMVAELQVRGSRIVRSSRRNVRRQMSATVGAQIGVSLTLKDQRIIDHSAQSQGFYVTSEYGRRAEFFSARARNIVSEGLDQGLGNDVIARDLKLQIGDVLGPRRSGNYWNVVANVFVNRSRTYGQLVSYDEAGIEKYRFEAVLDERTTNQCALLHGKEWEVKSALQRHEQVEQEQDPRAVQDLMPWIQSGADSQGNQILYTQDRSGNRTIIADVTKSRSGKDSIGTYDQRVSDQKLADMGANQPPLHALCRSTIVAVI